ncbi:hypothetical protein [Borreliella valaisiana]|uniref:Uncharacterized protein n=1 Tax=Borreliella valaisiana VS116 TaxID=445987 RepID=D6RX08_BORVA|nr:hypothetical protein [Borreliella valaisiana]EEF81708.1 conserved hypothetical protein [Borreliella valaisiana VS116]
MKKLPEIFYMSSKEVDILISQLGISSDTQKSILKTILSYKKDAIDYSSFIEEHSVKIRGLKGELDFLFRKLYEVKRGIITNKIATDGEFLPDSIILTDEASYDFYYYSIDDLFLKTYIGIELFSSLLTVKNIESSLLVFRNEFIAIADSDINYKFFEIKSQLKEILVWKSLIIPSSRALYFIEFVKKIFFNIASNNIVKDVFVRVKGLKLGDYERALEEGKNVIGAISKILSGIIEIKDEVLGKKGITFSKNYFVFLDFLNLFIKNEKDLEELKAVEAIKIDESLKAIEKTLEFKKGPIDTGEFFSILKVYSEGLNDPENFLLVANTYFFESKIHDILPKIFQVKENFYLYKPFAYEFFLEEYEKVLQFLNSELRVKIFKILSFGDDPSSIFTEEGLEEVINRLVVSRYIMNEYCLKNKVKFLDLIVSHYRRIYKTQSVQVHIKDLIKVEAAKYFKNSNELLPLYKIYKLDLYSLLNAAYKDLSLFKRIVLFLTGKHQSYKEALSRLDFRAGLNRSGSGLFDSNERVKRQLEKIRRQREEIKAQVRNSFPKKGTTPKQAVNKNYTKQEQDEAWVKFGDRIQKK